MREICESIFKCDINKFSLTLESTTLKEPTIHTLSFMYYKWNSLYIIKDYCSYLIFVRQTSSEVFVVHSLFPMQHFSV